jgi:hypothetical protein
MPEEKRVAIVQSNYVPWRGYFDLIASVDEFILLDDVQYTRRDWRNRNRIKTPEGTRWLGIPVKVSGRYSQAIYETEVADPGWAQRHWRTLYQNYREAPGYTESAEFVEELYANVPTTYLSEINRHFLVAMCRRLEIDTPLTLSLDYGPEGAKSARLVDLCRKANATVYVSGPSAKAYLEEEPFEVAGIRVSWFEYGPYSEYDQVHPPFDPQVSVVDTLLCTGQDAAEYVRPMQERDS